MKLGVNATAVPYHTVANYHPVIYLVPGMKLIVLIVRSPVAEMYELWREYAPLCHSHVGPHPKGHYFFLLRHRGNTGENKSKMAQSK